MPTLPIVGEYYHPPARALLAVLPAGAELQLVPEPENEFDPNAIKVLALTATIPLEQRVALDLHAQGFGYSWKDIMGQASWHLGYIPRLEAARLSLAGPTAGKLRFAADGKPQVELP